MRKSVILAALVFALALCGCGSTSTTRATQQSNQEQLPYTVNIVSAEVIEYEQGDAEFIAAIEFANNSNTEVAFFQAVPTVAALNGVSLGSPTYSDAYIGSDGSTPDYMLKVFPGSSTVVHVPFKCSGSGDVTVKCTLGYVDGTYPDMGKTLDQKDFTI